MSPILMLVKCLLLPGAVALVLFLVFRWLAGRIGATPNDGGVAAAASLAFAYAAGHAAIAAPAFPPVDVTDRVSWIARASLLAALASSAAAERPLWRWVNRVLFSALTVVAMIGPILAERSQTWTGLLWIVAVVAVFVFSWANIDALDDRVSPATLGVSLILIVFGTALALAVSGSVVLGQLCAALGASLVVVVALARGSTLRAGLGPVCSTVLGALLIDGGVYSELPAAVAVLLTAAPLTLWTARLPVLVRLRGWQRTLAVALMTILPVALAVVLSFSDSPRYEE
ncbi:MAG: hypothetical protein P4L84_21115 [Isosphaeraceae bacterium]|nr:hypothetical protein [Isosphaeraceae bacterium]